MLFVLAVELLSTDSYDPRILCDLLGNAKFEQIEAETGEDALTAVMELRSDLILMDTLATRHDRHETARRIKSSQEMNAVPIIAVIFCPLAGDDAKAPAADLQCPT